MKGCSEQLAFIGCKKIRICEKYNLLPIFYICNIHTHLLLINPFDPHSGYISDECRKLCYRVIQLEPNLFLEIPVAQIQRIFGDLLSGERKYPTVLKSENRFEIIQSVQKLFDDSRDQRDELTLLSDALRFLSLLGEPTSTENNRQSEASVEFIKQTISYIQNTDPKNLTLSVIAKEFSYNKAYFSSLFKQHFQMSFTDFCIHNKINNAKKMMQNGNCNLTEVCDRAGFNHYTYFYRKFREICGMTPSQYIEQYQATNPPSEK